ncbi:DNA polymerase III PolC-type-like [Solea senegalensis]|uniref:DNA polymerase III PolC-type-like n=1 Tax=Solea senegalensis TaxID=28829 RepID=A0AAV6SVW6_SOLSE|nr:DNA polymerase III PolC-type-like [Solea senegalensis]KAG7521845.1 DNA polymerase III PolC-type-like [Solea senegalensis]
MSSNGVIVFFDLETTGLNTHMCDIIQLSAVCGDQVFNVYVLPDSEISVGASKITGFTVTDDNLFCRGIPLVTTPLVEALTSFIEFLRSFHCPVLLAAHNAKWFDVPVLTRVLTKCSLLQEFKGVVPEYVDTLVLSRSLYPELGYYNQTHLVRFFLGKNYNSHNAVEDAKALEELFESWSPSKLIISNNICLF